VDDAFCATAVHYAARVTAPVARLIGQRFATMIAVAAMGITSAFNSLDASAQPAATRAENIPSDEELERMGAIIGEITFNLQNIFATDTPEENKSFFRLANQLHIKTLQATVEQQLLFQRGDLYAHKKLAESERLLRSRRYLYEVKIRPIAYRDGRVDIEVQTRDVWSLNPNFTIGRRGGANTLGIGVEELNLLGYGKFISASVKSDVDRDTVSLAYQDPQLFGSRWTLAAGYGRNSDGHARSLAIERPFYALDTTWSAGVRWRDDKRIEPIYSLGAVAERYQVLQRGGTMFVGWSRGEVGDWVSRFSTGVTYVDDTATKVSGSTLVPTDATRLAYPWVGVQLLQDDFQTLKNFDQIGRTEDINLGWQASAQLGVATKSFGSDRDALLLVGALSRGVKLGERSIALLDANINANINKQANPSRENTAFLSTGARYYFRQSPQYLLFTNVRVDASTNTGLTLGGDNGLRGYPQRYQTGQGRWLFSTEQRVFTDWFPFRIARVGGAVFIDVGRTWGKTPFAATQRGLLADAGFGLRLGNARLGFNNVIHIDLAFPIRPRDGISRVQFLIETKRSF
jgi:predicted DNA-binding transcriptional regulator AlpA